MPRNSAESPKLTSMRSWQTLAPANREQDSSPTTHVDLCTEVPSVFPALILEVSTAIFVFKHIFREIFTFKIGKMIEDLVPSREPGELKSI